MEEANNAKVIKAGVKYTIGNVLIKCIGVISAPVFARLLTTEEYGKYNIFISYQAILTILICLALHVSIKNAYLKFEGEIDKYTSSIALIPICIFVLLLSFVCLGGSSVGNSVGMQKIELLLLIMYSFSVGIITIFLNRMAVEYKTIEYLIISLVGVVGCFALALILICGAFNHNKYYGKIIAETIVYFSIATYVIVSLGRKAKLIINRVYWKYALKISVPIIPHGLSQIFLLQIDRIMIGTMVSNFSSGIYSFSYIFYSIVQTIGNSIDLAFSPWAFKQLKDNQITEVKKKGTIISYSFVILVGGILLFAPECIFVFGGVKYKESIFSTIPVVIASYFSVNYLIPATIEYYYEKTSYISCGTTIVAFLNIILNYYTIGKYGYIAAAYTTLLCYLVYFFIHYLIAKRLCEKWIIDMKVLMVSVLLLFVSSIVGFLFREVLFIRLFAFFALFFIWWILGKKLLKLNVGKLCLKIIRR